MQLSYAQRLEDYHLDLIFQGQQDGVYIDVGGGHPVADNVSFWFYLKGWRGLIIEPQRELATIYAHVRPRDSVVCSLVGRHEGEADFHVVDRLHGFSSTLEAHAQAAASFGAAYATTRVPMRTLASVAAEHGLTRVDFLKIDVEGAEADVIAGADWSRCRPRVVVVEAVTPGSMQEAWRTWEPLLLAQSYRYAFFDGLNRFYVADEAAELAARLPREPAAWDAVHHLWDFSRAPERADHPDHALARALVEGFLASLPSLDHAVLADLLLRAQRTSEKNGAAEGTDLEQLLFGAAEFPGTSPARADTPDVAKRCRMLMDSDRVRAALGRIACAYDGGHLMD